MLEKADLKTTVYHTKRAATPFEAYWRVGAGSLCCLHAAAGRGQVRTRGTAVGAASKGAAGEAERGEGDGDEGGHLDTEEEEVPQPMSSILEDLESWEAMRFQLCGDLDHRDWVLAEISTLAKMCEKILKLTADAKFVWPSTVSMADASPVNCSSWGYPKEPKASSQLLPPELLHSTPRARGQPVPLL
uniref:uncharacterized protein LOC114679448 n=1 Tax=Macaca mulatta TaxID=9544 RepID=UPI0010A210FD|nr:uncharacterized protein LOC114679448 [Macaca mulatta]